MTNTPEQANDDDRERFGMLLYQVFTTFSDADRLGRLDRDLLFRSQIYLDRFLRIPAVQAWWSRHGDNYNDPFRSTVESRLREIAAKDKV